VQLSDGSIRNGYTVKILNKRPEPRTFLLSLEGLPGAGMFLAGSTAEPAPALEIEVGPDRLKSVQVYVKTDPKGLADKDTAFTFIARDVAGGEGADEARAGASFAKP
jgi:polyferredoxin